MAFLLLFIIVWGSGGHSSISGITRLVGVSVAVWVLYRIMTRQSRLRAAVRRQTFPVVWETILQQDVPFFQALDDPEKQRFREEVQIFLSEKRITGIKTSVDDRVRVLIAASAIIPIFGFPGWEWSQISEILVYPSSFNDQYEFGGETTHDVLGMVGSGAMTRMMILSKPDLLKGFRSPQERDNVGIHEFVHLLDKSDGAVDGVPGVGLPAKAIVPWLALVHKEMKRIQSGHSDIKPYGLTSEAEFFAVVSEYFFANPDKLHQHHPELYSMLVRIFHQDPQARLKHALTSMVQIRNRSRSRNAPCPCGSGKKYKRCCLRHAAVNLISTVSLVRG